MPVSRARRPTWRGLMSNSAATARAFEAREGVERAREGDDLARQGRAVAVAVKAQSGPQGEKVPATGGTVADRFVLLQVMAAFEMEPPRLAVDRTEALALRARVFRSEGLCLLFQEGGDGSLDQSAADLPGQILHDAEVDVQPRSVRPEGASGHDFSPRGRQLTEFAEVFRAWCGARHGLSSLALTAWFPTPFLALCSTEPSSMQSRS